MGPSAYGAYHIHFIIQTLCAPLEDWMCVQKQTRQIRKRKGYFLREVEGGSF